MAFFDEFSKRINGIYQSAQKTTEVAKIQHQINQKQAEFDSLYHQIGQLYYSCRQRGVQPEESIDALCDRVTALAQEIDKLRGKVDEINGVCRCAVCGNVVEEGALFCSKCGAKLEVKAPAEPEKPAEPAPEAEPEAEAPAGDGRDVYINWPDARPEAAAEPEADEAGPEPEAAEPEPEAAEPETEATEPEPETTEPEPETTEPEPGEEPKPEAGE
ncbi:MAG: zinc-ribbon domain-containing protein [Clostridia bacterium]|nr:zinc-ribbon domain-containing protein [Clostridia bacterium]